MIQPSPSDPMAEPKPLRVRWSSLAVATAGLNVTALWTEFLEEVRPFLSDAHGFFSHTVPGAESGVCYLFTGEELPDTWEVTCQMAKRQPLPPLPDDHPDPKLKGKITKYPKVIDETDNMTFVVIEE